MKKAILLSLSLVFYGFIGTILHSCADKILMKNICSNKSLNSPALLKITELIGKTDRKCGEIDIKIQKIMHSYQKH